jgi:ribonuclease HI
VLLLGSPGWSASSVRAEILVAKTKLYLVKMADGQIKTYDNWNDCRQVVHGTSLAFASGLRYEEALEKLNHTRRRKANNNRIKKKKRKTGSESSPKPSEGICSDGATSGNPGPSEYQVTDLLGNVIVHRKLGIRSNNFAELAGIGAMVKYAIQSGETNILWSDSKIAMGWIFTQRIGQTVRDRALIQKMALVIRDLFNEHPELELKKWKTREWGEIPADFGRK